MNEPSVNETAFACPHCEAYTTQYWHDVHCDLIRGDRKLPFIPPDDFEERVKSVDDLEVEEKKKYITRLRKLRAKLVFTDDSTEYGDRPVLHNVFASQCYNCRKWALWVGEDLIYPSKKFGSMPNQDLPSDVASIVDEARSIIDASPKGAAALLRLAMQLLCERLGESGKNLNDDIANLVAKGLNPIVQKSLDVVRVIGNESVHPGSIDLNDDRETAVRLFDLINIVAEQMITQPKQVEALYSKLPEEKRRAIEQRDGNAAQQGGPPDAPKARR